MLPDSPSFPFRLQLPVLWGDMDALGHVNNLAYLRWFEEGRISYAREVGLLDERGLSVILAHQRCDYLLPISYPDRVELRLSTSRIGTSSMTLSFVIHSMQLGRPVAQGEGVLVTFDYAAKRTVPIPDAIRARLIAFETGSNGSV